jgi:DNA-nicking Smr family endonuclease
MKMPEEQPIHLPINGVLDLHHFKPAEVKDLVRDYLAECQRAGIFEVRVIHGKGIGNLRRTVHSILSRHTEVEHFADCSALYGGAGATLVKMRRGAPSP